jgi:myo-inositol-1(or 4)-monophosphatase
MEQFKRLTGLSHGVRRDGSAALDLCFVACGRLDGFWERKLSPWDIAAGSLIVEEAGGKVSDFHKGPLSLERGNILATNGLVHNEIIEALDDKLIPQF